MLKVFGHVYSNNKDDFDVIKAALEREGFTIAYEGGTNNGDVIKEVNSLTEDIEDAES